jgi:hypothetical protein
LLGRLRDILGKLLICAEVGEIHPEPSAQLPEVLLPEGGSGGVIVVVDGVAADYSDEEFQKLMQETAPIAERVAQRLKLQ